MALALVLFGLFSGSLLAILVGLFGSRRRLGFSWAFFLSLLLTPLGGLICALLSKPLAEGEENRWGCLAYLILIAGILIIVTLAVVALTMVATL